MRAILLTTMLLAGLGLMDMAKGQNLPPHLQSIDKWVFGQPKAGTIAHPGLLDESFNPDGGTDLPVYPIALRPDGKIVIGGKFTTGNGIGRNRIARLDQEGALERAPARQRPLDGSFDPGAGADSFVYTICLQPDGKIVIGGEFTHLEARNEDIWLA